MDLERILMGEELCDIEINFSQNLLKAQFKELNGLTSTLYQEKKLQLIESLIQNKAQIIHCKARDSCLNCKVCHWGSKNL